MELHADCLVKYDDVGKSGVKAVKKDCRIILQSFFECAWHGTPVQSVLRSYVIKRSAGMRTEIRGK